MKINSSEFWDSRFSSGYWENIGGRNQTRAFAEAQVERLRISSEFTGTLLDFGCGLGDAIPVYRRHYPKASLVGVDLSPAAIAHCSDRFGQIAHFICGDHTSCPPADIIVTSNVLEHLKNDIEVARALAMRCVQLFVTVPYREEPFIEEHLRSYDRHYFDLLHPRRVEVFPSRGWSQYGFRAHWWEIRLKNLLRPLMSKPLVRRRMQVMYCISGAGFQRQALAQEA